MTRQHRVLRKKAHYIRDTGTETRHTGKTRKLRLREVTNESSIFRFRVWTNEVRVILKVVHLSLSLKIDISHPHYAVEYL